MNKRKLQKAERAITALTAQHEAARAEYESARVRAARLREGMGAALVAGDDINTVAQGVTEAEAKRDALAAKLSTLDQQLTAARAERLALLRDDDLKQVDALHDQVGQALRAIGDALAGADLAEIERLAFEAQNLAGRHGDSRRVSLGKAWRGQVAQVVGDVRRAQGTLHRALRWVDSLGG